MPLQCVAITMFFQDAQLQFISLQVPIKNELSKLTYCPPFSGSLSCGGHNGHTQFIFRFHTPSLELKCLGTSFCGAAKQKILIPRDTTWPPCDKGPLDANFLALKHKIRVWRRSWTTLFSVYIISTWLTDWKHFCFVNKNKATLGRCNLWIPLIDDSTFRTSYILSSLQSNIYFSGQ